MNEISCLVAALAGQDRLKCFLLLSVLIDFRTVSHTSDGCPVQADETGHHGRFIILLNLHEEAVIGYQCQGQGRVTGASLDIIADTV